LINVNVVILDWTVRKLLGKENMSVELKEGEATVKGLIERLDKEYEGKLWETISKSNLNISILVNGRDIEFLRGMNAYFSDGDRVAIIPLVAGG
jgi:MoaD family protein